jgi:hypothetical protein
MKKFENLPPVHCSLGYSWKVKVIALFSMCVRSYYAWQTSETILIGKINRNVSVTKCIIYWHQSYIQKDEIKEVWTKTEKQHANMLF